MLNIMDLTLGYNGRRVLHMQSFALAPGAQCLITGPSGCGKTTLLYAIAGLITPMSGSITINGTPIAALPEAARDHFRGQNIGMIFQTLHLVRSLSVLDNLLLASYAADLPQNQSRAEEILATLGMAQKKHALPGELSQGQAQRVAIARAVLNRPALMLADEPTSSLDDASCENVITLIKQAANETGAALLISTHDSRVKRHFAQAIHLEPAP